MRFKVLAVVAVWAAASLFAIGLVGDAQTQGGPSEAPAGFDLDTTNGFDTEFCANQDDLVNSPNSPQIPEDECSFEAALEEFTGPETSADGLGPVFNAAGCGECHLMPNIGGSSQIVERRAGRFRDGVFTDHPGGSLIQDRALNTHMGDQEKTDAGFTNVTALRSSLSLFGDGFIEHIPNPTLQGIANNQPAAQRGQVINVPVSERPGTTRVGRFGHKGQQASLVSFSADAYVNEMGITSPLEPVEPTSNGRPVDDPVPGIDDQGVDVELFALFMRSLKVPPRGAITPDVSAGATLFNQIGCNVCHTPTIVTANRGDLINGGALRVTAALGNKVIHPFSDFLLHDVATGDGIVQNGGAATRNKIRTPALWGLRVRGRLMHDSASFNATDAIQRHGNQGAAARANFNALSGSNRSRVIAFLNSL